MSTLPEWQASGSGLPWASWYLRTYPERADWARWAAKNSRKQQWWARMLGYGPQPGWLRLVRRVVT